MIEGKYFIALIAFFLIGFLVTEIIIKRKRVACFYRGHKIEVIEDHNLDTGKIESVLVCCNRCDIEIHKHYIRKSQLSENELKELRHGYSVVLKFWKSLNDSAKKYIGE